MRRRIRHETRNIGQIVTRMQFQDLAKQRFEHVIDGMMLMKSGLARFGGRNRRRTPSPQWDQSEWLIGLLSGMQVGATRQRFLRGLLLGGTALDGIGALDVSSDEAGTAGEWPCHRGRNRAFLSDFDCGTGPGEFPGTTG